MIGRNGFKPLSTLEPDLEDSDVKDGGANVEMIPLTQAKFLDYGQGNDEDDISLGKHVSTSSNGSSRTVAENSHDFRGTGIYQPCKDKKRVDSRGRYETVLGHRASLLELSSADGGFDDLDVGAGKEGILSACWAEFLVPMRLLAERKVRGIIFVYGLISVRAHVASTLLCFLFVCLIISHTPRVFLLAVVLFPASIAADRA